MMILLLTCRGLVCFIYFWDFYMSRRSYQLQRSYSLSFLNQRWALLATLGVAMLFLAIAVFSVGVVSH